MFLQRRSVISHQVYSIELKRTSTEAKATAQGYFTPWANASNCSSSHNHSQTPSISKAPYNLNIATRAAPPLRSYPRPSSPPSRSPLQNDARQILSPSKPRSPFSGSATDSSPQCRSGNRVLTGPHSHPKRRLVASV